MCCMMDPISGKKIYYVQFPQRFDGIDRNDESFTLKHDGRGYPSMSNTGPNSNNSQFFITFRAVHHLDGLHVVFGKLVQGRRTLKKIESAGSKQGEPAFFVKIVNCGELLEGAV
ncbi:hypothetical protein IFM89_035352 [Coptis chinensis]|uniref:Peptidyl-prolyl cis-trans isomerase n=1 Tax=Coptis chinensis TaxID=261450 RepID=A0A835H1I3_9MAGN|nr:hypothetical protein IFM89_035352 [Coptis chinensis]